MSRGSRLDDGFTWKMTEPKQRDAVASVRKGERSRTVLVGNVDRQQAAAQ